MKTDLAYLLDIVIFARKVERFTAGIEEDAYLKDEVLQHALIRLISVVGEAANRVGPETRSLLPSISWREIAGMRNRLVHDYLNIDLALVWATAKRDLPALLAAIEPLVPPPPNDDESR